MTLWPHEVGVACALVPQVVLFFGESWPGAIDE